MNSQSHLYTTVLRSAGEAEAEEMTNCSPIPGKKKILASPSSYPEHHPAPMPALSQTRLLFLASLEPCRYQTDQP